ncbi:MAG TPA: maleylpyruvate isomerase family mycothiol-dependent enzyme [Micromonosporaceae bacterium]
MTRMHLGKEFWLGALRAEGAAFRTAVGLDEALDAPVPSCPPWTIAELVAHLGSVYAWVATHAARGTGSRPEPYTLLPTPSEPGELLAWWDGQYADLLRLLDTLDPGLPAWNWAPQAKVAGFWHRRMAHETSVHRWDAQMARGQAEPIEAKLAADGVAELLDSWLPAGRRKGPSNRVGMVHLRATDIEHEWFVRLRGEGVALLDTDTLLDSPDHGEKVRAAGTASDLQLALMGRVGFDVLQIVGDAGLLECLRTG